MPYNYTSFPLDMDETSFSAFPDVARAGSKAPDGVLVDASDGREVTLSSLWNRKPLVMEFGSLT